MYSDDMDDYKLPKSYGPLRRQAFLTCIVVIGICVMMTLFFTFGVTFAPIWQVYIVLSMWVGMGLIWAIGVFVAYTAQSRSRYVLTSDSLSIQHQDLLGNRTERLYRYDTIVSIDSFKHASGEYGSLKITLEHQLLLILKGIAHPDEQARRIKKIVSESRQLGA